jgi:hypothetical protein
LKADSASKLLLLSFFHPANFVVKGLFSYWSIWTVSQWCWSVTLGCGVQCHTTLKEAETAFGGAGVQYDGASQRCFVIAW